MPTGVAMGDAREQLFGAARRVLLRAGPDALTSRAVTAEAGCAKGVLHRHFADFDAFLAELIGERIARLDAQGALLRERAGTATVADNLSEALAELFDPVAVAVVGLVVSRDGLRRRLRASTPTGIPMLTEAAAMLAAYLAAERDLGRIAAGADVEALAPALVGAGHLLFADRTGTPPPPAALQQTVRNTIAGAAPQAPPTERA